MRTEHPNSDLLPGLRRLWKEAFGDSDDFLDSFYATAYSPDRCLCIPAEGAPAAALYWLDCTLEGAPLAYIYAVATDPDFRGQGLCRKLMTHTHDLLRARGYAGAVLVPQDTGLRKMYAGMGYGDAGALGEFSCTAAEPALQLREVGPGEFALLRRRLLPAGSVLQEGQSLSFLASQLRFYAGEDFLLAGYAEAGCLHAMEFLGSRQAAPGILKALGCREGKFRCPGNDRAFAMYCPLTGDAPWPKYFGFAFD